MYNIVMDTPQKVIWRKSRRQKAIDILGGKCVSCGTTEKLEFDHINNDREDRKHMIKELINYKWEVVEEELKKCQLLCNVCHGKKTALDIGKTLGGRHGAISTYINKACRCKLCRQAALRYEQSRYHIRNKRDREKRALLREERYHERNLT